MDLVLKSDVEELTAQEREGLAKLQLLVVEEPGEFLTLEQLRQKIGEVA